jgi:hypothetical protein
LLEPNLFELFAISMSVLTRWYALVAVPTISSATANLTLEPGWPPQVRRSDVKAAWSGIRPLALDPNAKGGRELVARLDLMKYAAT